MMQHIDFSTISIAETLSELKSSEAGLTNDDVIARLKVFGANELPEPKKRSILLIFLKQFKSILVAVLIVAAVLSWITGHKTDTYIILIVVLIDALIGFIQEWKAERAVSALHKMLVPQAKVIRENHKQVVKASELVQGDIILLEEGDYVPADARLIEAKHLRTIEASLTGESLPVNKTHDLQRTAVLIGGQKEYDLAKYFHIRRIWQSRGHCHRVEYSDRKNSKIVIGY